MFFRMLRRLAPNGTGNFPKFPLCQQHAGPLQHCIAENAQAESQDRTIAWFLVQPMHMGTGRLGSEPNDWRRTFEPRQYGCPFRRMPFAPLVNVTATEKPELPPWSDDPRNGQDR